MFNRQLLISELRRDEGDELTSYKDSLGYWTIGVGHLIDPMRGASASPFGADLRFGKTITSAQSEALLESDIVAKATDLDKFLPWWRTLNDTRQRVLLNMVFNLGIGGLLGFKNTLEMVKTGDYAGAARGMLASKWAKQVHGRADRLAKMMETGAV